MPWKSVFRIVKRGETAVTVVESSEEQIEAGIVQAETAVSGTIMTRNVKMGELVRPGISAIRQRRWPILSPMKPLMLCLGRE